jgi:MOSC domain-containing protein YiiM
VIGERGGEPVTSAIVKQRLPPGTVVSLSVLNLDGDEQADLTVHGGPDKAVYAYPAEHLPLWADELGGPLGPSPFGENLSTVGVSEAEACIGDRWHWGDAVLEVCQPRSPCFKLAMHRGRGDMAKLFRDSGRSGWYLRVLTPGDVPVDGPITVASTHPAGVTVADTTRAWADRHGRDRALLVAVAGHDRLADEWRLPLRARL